MRRPVALVALAVLAVPAACGGNDDEGAGGGDFCDRATLVEDRFRELDETFEAEDVPDAAAFAEVADTLDELAEDAPKAVAADLGTIADGARRIGEVFDEFDFADRATLSDPANASRLREISAEMQRIGEDVRAATQRVEDHLRRECGITFGEE